MKSIPQDNYFIKQTNSLQQNMNWKYRVALIRRLGSLFMTRFVVSWNFFLKFNELPPDSL